MPTVFPTICTDSVGSTRDFYCELLGFQAIFDSGWYVQLAALDDPAHQIGIVERSHETVPEGFRSHPAGVLISLEFDDVDEVFARVAAAGHHIVFEPRDEDFGQRHFMTVDPAGTLVDVITQIEPSQEYAQYFGPATERAD